MVREVVEHEGETKGYLKLKSIRDSLTLNPVLDWFICEERSDSGCSVRHSVMVAKVSKSGQIRVS